MGRRIAGYLFAQTGKVVEVVDPYDTGCIIDAHPLVLDHVDCPIDADLIQKFPGGQFGDLPKNIAEITG